MNITENIINDLMPAYFSGECSGDTKRIVEEYFQDHPEFARQSRKQYDSPFADKALPLLKAESEVKALKSTRRLIKIRSSILGLAIFFSLAPFSFFHIGNQNFFLIADRPAEAAVYGAIGLCFWLVYFGMKRKMRIL